MPVLQEITLRSIENGSLDQPKITSLLGLALLGGKVLDQQEYVAFVDDDPHEKGQALQIATQCWFDQCDHKDPNLYSESMTLACVSSYPEVRETILTVMEENLQNWHIADSSGRSKRLWSRDLSLIEKERYITAIFSNLVNLAEFDQIPSVRGQAAMLLSAFAQRAYNPFIGVRTDQFNFMEILISLSESEQNPQAKATKLLAYLSFIVEPDVYRRFNTGKHDEDGYRILIANWVETVSTFVDNPENAIEALNLITSIFRSKNPNLIRIKRERWGPLNLRRIVDIALNSPKGGRKEAIVKAKKLLISLENPEGQHGLSLDDCRKIQEEINDILFERGSSLSK